MSKNELIAAAEGRAAASSEWDLRGRLAASLTCWHRLTEKESDELVAMFQGSRAPATQQARKCAQCKKVYKHVHGSTGCPKCAPGVEITEVEFQKPIASAPATQQAGWKWVPTEPTEAMFTRFSQQIEEGVVYVGGFLNAYRCMLDAAPQPSPTAQAAESVPAVVQVDTNEHTYLCKAWGETDLPSAAIVRGLDGIRAFLIAEWLGDADAEDYAGEKTLPAVMDEMQEDWAREGKAFEWSTEFEIGGISVQRVDDVSAARAPAESEERGALPTIKGASITGHYVVVTPAGWGDSKAAVLRDAILRTFPVNPAYSPKPDDAAPAPKGGA